jgi:hypothetical protein
VPNASMSWMMFSMMEFDMLESSSISNARRSRRFNARMSVCFKRSRTTATWIWSCRKGELVSSDLSEEEEGESVISGVSFFYMENKEKYLLSPSSISFICIIYLMICIF